MGHFTHSETIDYYFNPENKCLFVFCIEGSITIGTTHLNKRDAIGIWETGSVLLKVDDKAEFIIIETVINQK